MDDQLDVLFRHRGMGQDPEPMDERVREERKRYATQLQRRAQAHVTAVLGGGAVMPDIDRYDEPDGDRLRELGIQSYLSVPVLVSGSTVAVMQAIDITEPDQMDHDAGLMEEAVTGLGQRLADESEATEFKDTGSSQLGLSPDSVLDLVLRQPHEVDESFEVNPNEWAVLNHLNGERKLSEVAQLATNTVTQASAVANALVERGLVRFGRENRRRL